MEHSVKILGKIDISKLKSNNVRKTNKVNKCPICGLSLVWGGNFCSRNCEETHENYN